MQMVTNPVANISAFKAQILDASISIINKYDETLSEDSNSLNVNNITKALDRAQ